MTARKKQSFLQGAVILGVATLGVKLIGAMFKIPLANLIGGVGMGDFTIAYDIFRPLNSLAVAGLPVAVSKLTSESVATGRLRDARRILRLSSALFFVTGAAGCAVMLLGARPFASILGSPDSFLTIAALAPALFFCCVMSAYRGYYQGLKNMYPTAVSQVIEAVCKLAAGILLSLLFMRFAAASLETPDSLVERLYGASGDRRVLISQFGAVGAVLGVTLSTACGALFLWLRHRLCGDGISRGEWQRSPAPAGRRELLRRMVKIALPVCLGSVMVHLTTLIDLASILNRLDRAMRLDANALLSMYRGLIPEGYSHAETAKFLYGTYSGIAVNIFNLVPSMTTTLGVSILPAVAGAWAAGNRALVKRNVESMLRVTALVVFPAGCGLMALSEPITLLLYGSRPMEAKIAAMLLRSLAAPMVFVSLATPVNAVLQAVGRVDMPVRLMAVGGALKLGLNFLLVGQPRLNIQAAPAGTLLCYLTIVLCSLRVLRRSAGLSFHYGRIFLKPALGGILCGVAASTAYDLLGRWSDGGAVTAAAILVGGVFYLAVILLSRALLKEDVFMLPGGEKIAKILEKHGMIG